MLLESEKIAHRLISIGREQASKTVRVYAALLRDAEKAMQENGWVQIDVHAGTIMHDGQPVHWVKGKPFVLPPDEFKRRLARELDTARVDTSETKSVIGTESLSTLVCPKCADSLQHTAVCPACAAGKLGYRHRYNCACGGVDLISKDKL
jgi:hypothetical protein